MAFTAPQREDLAKALTAAFTYKSLAPIFRARFELSLSTVTSDGAFNESVEELIAWAEMNGWERPLVRLLHEERANQPTVLAFIGRHREFPPLLLKDEREQLRIGLFSVIKTVGDLRALLSPPIAEQLPDMTKNAVDESSAEPYLEVVVRWADYFGPVVALLDRVLDRFPADAVLQAQARPLLTVVATRTTRHQSAKVFDPYESCDLDGTLMIDRTPLRAAIRSLSMGGNPRIVGVAGDARSGKTHSKYFIQHIAEIEQKYDAVIVDLNDEAPATFSPYQLIRSIVRQWGRNDLVPLIPPRDESEAEARWVIDLADFLVGEIRKAQRLLVIVLDGFANDKLAPLTRELVSKLVRKASTEKFLRLVLLHYPDDVLGGEPPGRIDTHRISLLTEADVREFVKKYARSHGDDPPDEAVTLVVNSVFKTPPPSSNEEIAQRVDTFLRKLMQP